MPQPIRLPFPKMGVIRNFDRSDQNGQQQGYLAQFLPESAFDALNVFPYDRLDRLRGGQRPGTARLFSAVASAAVMVLGQTTYALDPNASGASASIFTELFTEYANNTVVNSTGTWLVFSDFAGTTPQNTEIVNNPPGNVSGGGHTVYNGSPLSLGTSYTIAYTFKFDGTLSSSDYQIHIRANGNNLFSGLSLDLEAASFGGSTTVFITDTGSSGIASGAGPALTNGSTHVLKLVVNGDTLTGFLDGVQYVTTTASTGAAFSGWGFTYPAGASTVTNVVVTSGIQSVYRKSNLVAVSNGTIFVGDLTGVTAATGGSNVLAQAIKPQVAFGQGNAYFVDGTASVQRTVLSGSTNAALVATAGTVPANCTIAAIWRDRLILAAPASAAQNFFMSRVGTHTDFDYSQPDPAAAFAGSASTAGHIGDPITALMPFTDDVMLIGGDHHLWRVNGDPADGGSIDLVSDAIGVLGPNAWTKDPSGNIYFLGTGGLFKVAAGGGPPALLTDKTYNQYFTAIDRSQNYLTLVWDRDRQGLYIFTTPVQSGLATHLFYDARNGGVWPVKYPNGHGPMAACIFDGSSSASRTVLLGGRDGVIRQVALTALDDDGQPITSSLTLGPVQPATPTGDGIISGMDVTLGEQAASDSPTVFNCVWTLKGGKTANEVTEGTARHTVAGTFSYPGYQSTRRHRLRGGWFSLTISNNVIDTYWSMEHATLHFEGQGKQR